MLAISLPVFNEEAGIEEFLKELSLHLSPYEPRFVVVDDHSTDTTPSVLKRLESQSMPLVILRNEENLGHGGSVLRGLAAAVELRPTRVVLCDGDGQFDGVEIASLVKLSLELDQDITEGTRSGRNDPWFRRILSFGTRLLVWYSAGERAKDANTPLRVLKPHVAADMLSQIPAGCPVPNLAMSALSRAKRLKIKQVQVSSRPPRRRAGTQDHWKQAFSLFPSRRLIRFAWNALVSWRAVHRYVHSIK